MLTLQLVEPLYSLSVYVSTHRMHRLTAVMSNLTTQRYNGLYFPAVIAPVVRVSSAYMVTLMSACEFAPIAQSCVVISPYQSSAELYTCIKPTGGMCCVWVASSLVRNQRLSLSVVVCLPVHSSTARRLLSAAAT